MGKNLIIKGADFSENGIATLISWSAGYTNTNLHGERTITSTYVYCPTKSELQRLGLTGKAVKYIKLYAVSAGTITVYKTDCSSTPYSASDPHTYSVMAGMNIIELDSPITITSAVGLAIQGANVLTYWRNAESYPSKGWVYLIADSTTEPSAVRIPVDFGVQV